MENFEYKDDKIEKIHHTEGYISPREKRADEGTEFVGLGGLVWQYNYVLKDHLGNTRVTFADLNIGNNNLNTIEPNTEISQINHYYPFGLNMEGNWNGASADAKNKYQYNGKELQTDFGLDWNDYGARMYDAVIGRWNATDPLGEKTLGLNPYHYALSNPIMFIDPTGMEAEFDKNGNLTRATGKDAANWIRGQQKAMDKAAESKEDPTAKLRGVTVTVTDKIVGSGTLIGFPADASAERGQRNGQTYELPLYDVIVSGTDQNGIAVERHFMAFRYGIEFTEEDKKNKKPAKVVGLSQKQSYKLNWTFMPHFEEFAWNLVGCRNGANFIHRGPEISKSDWGGIGCIEIVGKNGWANFNSTIQGFAGSNDNDVISKQKLLTIVIMPCTKPPLVKAK